MPVGELWDILIEQSALCQWTSALIGWTLGGTLLMPSCELLDILIEQTALNG